MCPYLTILCIAWFNAMHILVLYKGLVDTVYCAAYELTRIDSNLRIEVMEADPSSTIVKIVKPCYPKTLICDTV